MLVARRLVGAENGDKAEETVMKEPTSVPAEPAKKIVERSNSDLNLDNYHGGKLD